MIRVVKYDSNRINDDLKISRRLIESLDLQRGVTNNQIVVN